jgi:four helix bundle protein
MAFKFEKLNVWQKSLDYSAAIHEVTLTFPKHELYILSSQIKRAADSVNLNIAEGSTGQSDAEFSKFLGYAIRSAIEVVSCLYLGRKRGLITEIDFQRLYKEAEEPIRMTQALRNSIKPKK